MDSSVVYDLLKVKNLFPNLSEVSLNRFSKTRKIFYRIFTPFIVGKMPQAWAFTI